MQRLESSHPESYSWWLVNFRVPRNSYLCRVGCSWNFSMQARDGRWSQCSVFSFNDVFAGAGIKLLGCSCRDDLPSPCFLRPASQCRPLAMRDPAPAHPSIHACCGKASPISRSSPVSAWDFGLIWVRFGLAWAGFGLLWLWAFIC